MILLAVARSPAVCHGEVSVSSPFLWVKALFLGGRIIQPGTLGPFLPASTLSGII